MKELFNKIVNVAKDKLLHIGMCMIIALLVTVFMKFVTLDKVLMFSVGWASAFLAGIGKEIYDEVKYGGADSADWLADVIGATLGTLIAAALIL